MWCIQSPLRAGCYKQVLTVHSASHLLSFSWRSHPGLFWNNCFYLQAYTVFSYIPLVSPDIDPAVPGISATVFFYVQFHARTQFPPVLWRGTTAFLTVLMCGWISGLGIRSWFHRVLHIQPQKKLVLCITGPDFS